VASRDLRQELERDEREHRPGGERERDRKEPLHLLDEQVGDHCADRLRRARTDRGPELARAPVARCGQRDRDARPLRDVLRADRDDHEQTQSGRIRRIRGADSEPLGQAVHEQHEEHEQGRPALGTRRELGAGGIDQPTADEEECDAESRAPDHVSGGSLIGRGKEQAHDRCDGHHAPREAKQPRSEGLGAFSQEEHRHRSETGRDSGGRGGQDEHEQVHCARVGCW
jgi:hypothetical protein